MVYGKYTTPTLNLEQWNKKWSRKTFLKICSSINFKTLPKIKKGCVRLRVKSQASTCVERLISKHHSVCPINDTLCQSSSTTLRLRPEIQLVELNQIYMVTRGMMIYDRKVNNYVLTRRKGRTKVGAHANGGCAYKIIQFKEAHFRREKWSRNKNRERKR